MTNDPPSPGQAGDAALAILAIDDAAENLSLIAMLAEEFFPGALILTATAGRAGLELARSHAPDIILLDAIMPEMDGFEVCRALKRNPATAFIPVLMVSGIMTGTDDRVTGLEGGADGYICKPYEAQELVAQMNALLRLKKSEDALRLHKKELERELEQRTGDLRASEAKFRSLFENSPDAVLVQNQQGLLQDVNPAACALLKMTRAELIGAHVRALVPETLRDRVAGECRELLAGGMASLESVFLTRGGETVPVEIRASCMKLDGGEALLLHVRDIRERKAAMGRESELQARLIRSQRMESLGILAGGVAHDLNNILGPMVAYPELVLEKLPADSPCRGDIEQMESSATRAVAVIQDLLALARRGNYQTEPVQLNDVVQLYAASPEFRDIQALYPQTHLATHLDADLPIIMGSTPHLMQVLMNLTNNAYEAMPHGGRVTITTHCQYISSKVGVYDTLAEGDYVLLKVADQGQGITPNDLEHIFEPFYSRKAMGRSGSGLGLPVVYGIVKDLNGLIDVQTHPGTGTAFLLYFPVARARIERNVPRAPSELRGTETLLVIDDVDEQRMVAQTLLSNLGYRVAAVKNGREAVDYVRQHQVDLLLLDMILEDKFDGLDTYREILEIRPEQRCVIVSGFSETNRVRRAQSLGAGPYIRKPYTRSRLGRAVREELDRPARVAA